MGKTIAERLRESAGEKLGCPVDDIANAVTGEVASCIGSCAECHKEWYRRLADAIEAEQMKAIANALREEIANPETVGIGTLLDVAKDLEYYSNIIRNAVKRPEPEVLDADGVPIKVGDTVYSESGKELVVERVDSVRNENNENCGNIVWCGEYLDDFQISRLASQLTHRKPDTLESVVTEMLAEWDENNEEFLDMDSYFARFRKLMEAQR